MQYLTQAGFILMFCSVMLSAQIANSQRDNNGSRDSRYVPRLDGYYIAFDNQKEYDEFNFWVGDKFVSVGGHLHLIHYTLRENAPVFKEKKILRIYSNLLKKRDGTELFSGIYPDETLSNPDEGLDAATFMMQQGTLEIWIQVTAFNDGEDYELAVIEGREIRDLLNADELLSSIQAKGQVDVYINFEVNQYKIRPESEPIIREVSKMLDNDPKMKLIIEGHTDNTGVAHRNKLLSEKRAASVKEALISRGISADRLSVVGYGQEKPIADNSTEEGRETNRRVVLVRQ